MNKKRIVGTISIVILILIISAFFIINKVTTIEYRKLDNFYGLILKIDNYINNDSLEDKSVYEMRKILKKNNTRWLSKSIKFSDIKTIDVKTNSNQVPLRIYTPEDGDNFPIIIYVHGGSWIFGDIDEYDNICKNISKNSKAIVISVNYRLAPEDPFPAGLNDVYNALIWSYNNAHTLNGDCDRIAVVGDSAGGNLSAAVSQMASDKNGPKITCQVLIYPSTNIYELNTKSWAEFGKDYNLKNESFEKFISLYAMSLDDRKNYYASPILSPNLDKLPDTLIITAEFDPLRDDGESYGKMLKDHSVEVVVSRYNGMMHGFVMAGKITKKSDKALNEISVYLKEKFNTNN